MLEIVISAGLVTGIFGILLIAREEIEEFRETGHFKRVNLSFPSHGENGEKDLISRLKLLAYQPLLK